MDKITEEVFEEIKHAFAFLSEDNAKRIVKLVEKDIGKRLLERKINEGGWLDPDYVMASDIIEICGLEVKK